MNKAISKELEIAYVYQMLNAENRGRVNSAIDRLLDAKGTSKKLDIEKLDKHGKT